MNALMCDFSYIPFKKTLDENDVLPNDEEVDANVKMVPVTANLTVNPVFGSEERPVFGAKVQLECTDLQSKHTATEQAGGSYVFENAVPTHESEVCTLKIKKKGYVIACILAGAIRFHTQT